MTRLLWAVALLLALVGAALGWLVFFSPVFSARTIVIMGTEQVTDEQVLRAAAVPRDLALARLPLASIADRVEQLDAVATVQVKRDWPDTLRIVVTERRPVAVVRTAAGFGVVGSDGSIYQTEPLRPSGLPLLLRLSMAPVTTSAVSPVDSSIAAFDVASSLPHSLRTKVDQVTAESVQAVRLVLRNGAIVEWGSPGASQRKAEVLAALLGHQAARYDVSAPDTPAWSG